MKLNEIKRIYWDKMRKIDKKIYQSHDSFWINANHTGRPGKPTANYYGLLIFDVDTGRTYISESECARDLGVSRMQVCRVLSSDYTQYKTCSGHNLRYIRNPKWIHSKEIIRSDIADIKPELLRYMDSYKDWVDLFLEDIYESNKQFDDIKDLDDEESDYEEF